MCHLRHLDRSEGASAGRVEGEQDQGDGGSSGHVHWGYLLKFKWRGLLKRVAAGGAPGPSLARLSSQGLSASLKPGCVGGHSLGAWPGVLSQCIMNEGLPVPWLGWGVGSSCSLSAEGLEGSAQKLGLDGPEGTLLGDSGASFAFVWT